MASVEDLERRVEWLEDQARHVLPQKIDAVAYGLSLVHEDVRRIREVQDSHTRTLASHGEMLRSHGGMLEEILRRLPPAPGAG